MPARSIDVENLDVAQYANAGPQRGSNHGLHNALVCLQTRQELSWLAQWASTQQHVPWMKKLLGVGFTGIERPRCQGFYGKSVIWLCTAQ